MPNLKVRDGDNDFIHQIQDDVASIGRADTNTIEIGDAKASKEHCRLERVGNRWKLVDLESKNGTKVNGDFCNKAWLDHGDTIEIGKAELRFGVEGAERMAAPIRAERPAQRRSAPPRDERSQREDGWEDELPSTRRYGKSGNDMLIIIGSVVLGAVLILVIVANMASGLQKDQHNLDLIETSREMKRRDQWKEALEYLQREVDTQGSAYNEVLKEMRLIESGMDAFYRRRDEEAARDVLSKVSRKIKAYNAGKRSHTPEDILKLVNTLKTKYPATESAKLASARYRAWFAGRVPDRASDVMRSGGQLLRDWQEAEDRSHEYVKKWEFRQARETIEIFLTAREAVLDQADLDKYREKVEQALGRVDSLADGRYRAQQRIAWNLEKKKRFDQAVKVYQEIIDKFGIDLYRRKAQEEINKIKGKRRGG